MGTDERMLVPGPDAGTEDARWGIASHVSHLVRRHFPAEVLAVAAHGSLAHGDDREGSDIELTVVTFRAGTGPQPTAREIDGWIVDVSVVGIDDLLYRSRVLTSRWPVTADKYLHARTLFDERGCFARVRDTHLSRLAEANGAEFATLARDAWCQASSLYRRAVRATEYFDTDGALLLLAEARIGATLVDGLLTRTYFRSAADAGRKTGIGGLDMTELSARLAVQGEDLAKRGRPVSGGVADLLR